MLIKFKDLVEIETFCQLAEQYDGDVIVTNGSIAIDGESVVGIVAMGANKWLELHIAEEYTQAAKDFKIAIRQMGIKTKGE